MSSDLFEIILPSFAFFMGFFLLFTLLELLVTLSLNIVIFHYWGFYIAKKDLPTLERNRRTELGISLFIASLILAMVHYSRIFDALFSAVVEVRVFAFEVFLSMMLIYLITTRELLDDDLIKKAHKYLYFVMSSAIFISVVLLANAYYAPYKDYIHYNVFLPMAQNRRLYLASAERERLLVEFRQMVYKQLCPQADFSEYYRSGRTVSFAYIVTQPDLKIALKPLSRGNIKGYTSGHLCSNGKTSFLLTDYGQWYWVTSGEMIAQK
jgi:hypothetical protein